jgi:hypothetical protein
MKLTEEQCRELLAAGDTPTRVSDPETARDYVVVRAELYDRPSEPLYNASPWTDEEMDLLAQEAGEMLDQFGKQPCA